MRHWGRYWEHNYHKKRYWRDTEEILGKLLGNIKKYLGQFWLLEYVHVQLSSSPHLRVRVLPLLQQPKGLQPSAGSFLMLLLRGLLFLECSAIAGDSECSSKVGSGGIGLVSKTASFSTFQNTWK